MIKILANKLFWFLVVIPIATITVVFVVLSQREPAVRAIQMVKADLADYGAVSDFSMTERSGETMTLAGLKGSPWIASFMFAQCAGQCPTMNFKITGLQDSLPDDVKILSFSVDPENDTPAVLSRYAKQFNPQNGKWFFLAGGKPVIDTLLKSFHVNSSDDPMLHSLRIALIDREGRIRGYYDTGQSDAFGKLLKDLQVLQKGPSR